MSIPATGTYPAYLERYTRLVDAESINDAIDKYSKSFVDFFSGIDEEKSTYRYAENKWSLKEVLLHIADTERVFTYRALSISRGEKNPLPGFDENIFAEQSNADGRSWKSILKEFIAARNSTDLLLKSFTGDQLNKSGITNGQPNTAHAISYVIFGHILHHINITKERYL